jgi:hypothetical protein
VSNNTFSIAEKFLLFTNRGMGNRLFGLSLIFLIFAEIFLSLLLSENFELKRYFVAKVNLRPK